MTGLVSVIGILALGVALLVGAGLVAAPVTLATVATLREAARLTQRQRAERRARDEALGLRQEGRDLVGQVDGRDLRLATEVVSTGKSTVTWWVAEVAVPEVAANLALVPVNALGGWRHGTGDETFDAVLRVPKAYPSGLAWLDAPTRKALVRERHKLAGGVLSISTTREPSEADLRRLVALANRMGAVEPVSSLADIATTDGPKVRVRAMEQLAHLDRARAAEVARDRLESELLEERSLAWVLVGDRAELRARMQDGSDAERHALLEALSRVGTPELVAAVAAVAPTGPVPRPLWFALTAAVAAFPTPSALHALVQRARDPLAEHGDFAADRLLVALTAFDDPAVEGAVAQAIGQARGEAERGLRWLADHGSVASVPAVDALLDGTWPLTELREVATATKRALQSRATGERGGLAEVEAVGGAVSEASGHSEAARRGRLALRQ